MIGLADVIGIMGCGFVAGLFVGIVAGLIMRGPR